MAIHDKLPELKAELLPAYREFVAILDLLDDSVKEDDAESKRLIREARKRLYQFALVTLELKRE